MFTDSDDFQDDDVSIESAFGLWKDREVTKESLCEKAWAETGNILPPLNGNIFG